MKLLLDQGLPRTAAKLLSEAGVETIHVGDVGYASADDANIIEFARQGGFVIVTLDADFHALLALSGAIAPSVIRIRMEGLRSEALTSLLRTNPSALGQGTRIRRGGNGPGGKAADTAIAVGISLRYIMDIQPIRTEADHETALAEIERLFDAAPNTPENDRLDVSTTLVEAYEMRHYPIPEPDPVEAIKYYMESRGVIAC
jgi:predicted nuclease of predicted toxin-antitoxin system